MGDRRVTAGTAVAVIALLAGVGCLGYSVWYNASMTAGIIAGEDHETSVGDLSGANLKTILGLNSTDPNMAYNWTDSETGDSMVFNYTSGYWCIFDLDANLTLRITKFDMTLCDVDLQFSNGTAQDYVNLTEPVTIDLLHTVTFYGQVPTENYTALVLNSTGISVGFEASYTSPNANVTLSIELDLQTSEVYATPFTINYTIGGPCNVTSETELTTYLIDNADSFRDLYIIYAYVVLWILYWL